MGTEAWLNSERMLGCVNIICHEQEIKAVTAQDLIVFWHNVFQNVSEALVCHEINFTGHHEHYLRN